MREIDIGIAFEAIATIAQLARECQEQRAVIQRLTTRLRELDAKPPAPPEESTAGA